MFTIGFNVKDEHGGEHSMTSTESTESEAYDNELDFIGQKLNIFLKQCGYCRKNDFIFMEDVNADEYCALGYYLNKLRANDI